MTELAVAIVSAATAWLLVRYATPSKAVLSGPLAISAQSNRRDLAKISRATSVAGRIGRIVRGGDERRSSAKMQGPDRVDADVLKGVQVLGAAAGALIGLGGGSLAALTCPVAAACGYQAPVLAMKMKLQRRRDEIAKALPDAVDLLAVCTQAGLNLSLSLKRVAAGTPGLLGNELRRTVEEIELGVSRNHALNSLRARTRVEDIEGLVATLASADRFGTQVSASLATYASEIRQTRKRTAEEQARRAPVKILFPLIFLILPAFVMLTVVPLILGALQSLGF